MKVEQLLELQGPCWRQVCRDMDCLITAIWECRSDAPGPSLCQVTLAPTSDLCLLSLRPGGLGVWGPSSLTPTLTPSHSSELGPLLCSPALGTMEVHRQEKPSEPRTVASGFKGVEDWVGWGEGQRMFFNENNI